MNNCIVKSKNFLIVIGGNRCGTTSLFHYLSNHPQVIPTIEKESRFFLDADYDIKRRSVYAYDGKMDTYLKFFPGEPEVEQPAWYLDSSPGFLYSAGIPDRMHSFFKNHTVFLVALLRDPVDRFISWFYYDKQIGNIPMEMSMEQYYIKNIEADAKRPYNRLKTGRYSLFLKHYRELFPETLAVYDFEDLKENPNKLIGNILNKTGLNSVYTVKETPSHNSSKKVKSEVLNNIYISIRQTFHNSIPRGGLLYKYLKQASKKYQKINYKVLKKEEIDAHLRNDLLTYYDEEYENMKNVIEVL